MEFKNQNFVLTAKLDAAKETKRTSNFLIANDRIQCSSGSDICVMSSPSNINASSCKNLRRFKFSDDKKQHSKINSVESDDSNSFKIDITPTRKEIKSKLKAELCKYKKELEDYTSTTKDLEEKYLKINFELNEMQQKHDRIVARRNVPCGDFEALSDCSATGSEYSLQRKYTQIFDRDKSRRSEMPNESENVSKLETSTGQVSYERKKYRQSCVTTKLRQTETNNRRKLRQLVNNENEPPSDACTGYNKCHDKSVKDIYKVLKNVMNGNSNSRTHQKGSKLDSLQSTITNLQNEQNRFTTIIEQQQNCLQDYHSRCVKAQHIMKTQQMEIQKLNSNNHQLETDITSGIDQLRHRIETKLEEVAELPQMMKVEKAKHDRVLRENRLLNERIRAIQAEANQLKIRIEEIANRKMATMTRLKAAERDLKIFKNYNIALKNEKRKLNEEMQKIREQMDNTQNCSKRTMNRQREQAEKQRRELQKRIFELEMKLSRSQSSTTSLIQERDCLITELQSQLNTLVHNFEVSQKHIRVLRKHIYSTTGNSRESLDRNRILSETA